MSRFFDCPGCSKRLKLPEKIQSFACPGCGQKYRRASESGDEGEWVAWEPADPPATPSDQSPTPSEKPRQRARKKPANPAASAPPKKRRTAAARQPSDEPSKQDQPEAATVAAEPTEAPSGGGGGLLVVGVLAVLLLAVGVGLALIFVGRQGRTEDTGTDQAVVDAGDDGNQHAAADADNGAHAHGENRQPNAADPNAGAVKGPDNPVQADAGKPPPGVEPPPNQEAQELAREATALLVVGTGTGTAFCVHESGLFVTTSHGLEDHDVDDMVRLVLRSGEANEMEYDARVARKGENSDIVLLAALDEGPFAPLPLGTTDGLVATDQVTAIGFPFVAEPTDRPAINVNDGRVTSLRRADGELSLIQINADVDPGNSGGPLTGEDGSVLGVIVAGIQNSGVHFAIPVGDVRELLAKPVVAFDVPDTVNVDDLRKRRTFAATVTIPPFAEKQEFSARLTIDSGVRRTVPMQADGSGFTADVSLVEAGNAGPVVFTGDFDEGEISGTTPDTMIVVKDKPLRLSALDGMTRQGLGAWVVRIRGSKRSAVGRLRPDDLRKSKVTLEDGSVVEMDLRRAKRLTFGRNPDSIELVLEVLSADGEIVTTQVRSVAVDGVATETEQVMAAVKVPDVPDVAPQPADNAKLKAPKEVKLPGTIDDVCFGAGGRYMICKIPSVQKAAVIDLATAEVLHYIPVPSSTALLTAGQSHLVMVIPESNVVSRYSLETFEKELTKTVLLDAPASLLAMGNASKGPVLIGGHGSTRGTGAFLDLKTLKPIPVRVPERSRLEITKGGTRVSSDGTTFGFWRHDVSPMGLFIYRLIGRNLHVAYSHTTVGHVIPSPDGSFVHTAKGPLPTTMNLDLAGGPTFANPAPTFPAAQGNLYVRVTGREKNARATLHVQGNPDPIASLNQANKALKVGSNYTYFRGKMTLEKRIVLAPAFGVMALTFENRVVVSPFSLKDILDKSGTDYLAVVSAPKIVVRAGGGYRYTLKVLSKNGGVKFSLDSGPPGMKIDDEGNLSWRPAVRLKGTVQTVIVSVSDDSGQELLHTFKLYCE